MCDATVRTTWKTKQSKAKTWKKTHRETKFSFSFEFFDNIATKKSASIVKRLRNLLLWGAKSTSLIFLLMQAATTTTTTTNRFISLFYSVIPRHKSCCLSLLFCDRHQGFNWQHFYQWGENKDFKMRPYFSCLYVQKLFSELINSGPINE